MRVDRKVMIAAIVATMLVAVVWLQGGIRLKASNPSGQVEVEAQK